MSELKAAEIPQFYHQGLNPPFFISPKVQVQEVAGKGLGVIALDDIEENELIECCPLILLKYDKELKWNWLKRFYKAAVVAIFDDYLWWWHGRKNAILLGYGNLYNSAKDYNAIHYKGEGRKFIFVAHRKISAGEEITVHYGYMPFCFEEAKRVYT